MKHTREITTHALLINKIKFLQKCNKMTVTVIVWLIILHSNIFWLDFVWCEQILKKCVHFFSYDISVLMTQTQVREQRATAGMWQWCVCVCVSRWYILSRTARASGNESLSANIMLVSIISIDIEDISAWHTH